jgi:hypothetical protein
MQRLSGRPAETAAPLMIEGNMRNGKYMMGFVAAPRNKKSPLFFRRGVGIRLIGSLLLLLICGRLLDMIDHKNVCRCVLQLQFQAKLFLNCCE